MIFGAVPADLTPPLRQRVVRPPPFWDRGDEVRRQEEPVDQLADDAVRVHRRHGRLADGAQDALVVIAVLVVVVQGPRQNLLERLQRGRPLFFVETEAALPSPADSLIKAPTLNAQANTRPDKNE